MLNFNTIFTNSKTTQNNFFESVFDNSINPALLLSRKGEIIKCNHSLLNLYNLTADEILNKNYFDILQQKQITPAFSSLNEILDQPNKTPITTINDLSSSKKTIQWTITIVQNNDQIENFCLYGMDISTYANTSTMTKVIQSSIIDHLPNHHVFWKDKNGVYLGCNKIFATSLGFDSTNDVIGKTDYDFPVKKEDSDAYVADDQEVMRSKKPKLNIEEPQSLDNGETRILLTSKVPLFDENNDVYGVLAIYSDITKQKLNELKLMETNQKLEKSYQVKSEFIRNISHDIRTPLSGIQQTVLAISEAKIPEPEVPEYAFAAWESSNRLMDLFNQVIDISKGEHFDFEDNVVKFDLYKLLDDLNETYKIVAMHKNINLEIEYSESRIPQFLVGKHLRLHRILMNLMGNALKFTEKGSVKLIVEKAEESNEQIILRFSVIDTGPGIPKEKHDIIFEPFTRLTPSFKGQYHGSGLGLHVVKEYIEKMRGEIYVESEEGNGSMFTCILPFKRSILNNDNDVIDTDYGQQISDTELVYFSENRFKKETKPETAPSSHVQMNNDKVLLVEDDPLAQRMGALLLKNIGYRVEIAQSAEEAIQLTEKNQYDIIYMDIGLPGIDGIEATKRIRNNKNNLSQKAFIAALTAHADEEISKQCLDAGMQKVLFKPITTEKLQVIHNILASPDTMKTKVFDLDLWKSRVGNNMNTINELFRLLAQDLSSTKSAIMQSYAAKDLPQLKAVTHKLKGSLKYCGLPRLETAIIAIEGSAKINDLDGVNKWYQETLDAIDDTLELYNTWKKDSPQKK